MGHVHARLRRTTAAVTAPVLVAALLVAPSPAAADPGPVSARRMNRLSNQVEVLAEQWSGLRVQLRQARRTAATARRTAVRGRRRLDGMRRQVGRLAAASYMAGDGYSLAALAASGDPQGVLDRAATVRRLSTRDDDVLRRLVTAITVARRTRDAATRRAATVRGLRGRLAAKRGRIEKLLSGWQDRLTANALRAARTGHRFPPSALHGTGAGVRAARAALREQGRPYVWGAAGPTAFDCSGLVQWAYRAAGIRLPKYTLDQFHAGTPVPRDRLQPGDLVFFYPPSMHHVGVYIGDGMMVHAPHTGDVVRVSSIAGRAYGGGVRVAR